MNLVLWTLLLLLSSLVRCDLPSESGPPIEEPFPRTRCEEALRGWCRCVDYEILVGLQCRNVSDFDAFARTLAGGSVFEANTTYEINLEGGLRVLPKSCLRGLIVFRLFLDDPDTVEVEEGAFDGVLRLRRFHVRTSSLKKVPDFRTIRDSLRNVNLDNSMLTSLEGDGLKNLSLVESLSFVNNSIRRVASDVFQGTENVIIFDISYNELTFLPPSLFDPWTKLKKAVLSHNRLLHVDHLFVNTHPKFIYLDHNSLTDLDSVLHPDMSEVETLQLSHNPIEKVTEKSFNGRVNNTRFLYLDHCRIVDFVVRHYTDLSLLATLDLSYNLIEEVTNQSVGFGYNVELDFTGNRIREFNAELPFNVKRVYLNRNLLTSVGRTLQFSQMSEVSMADNRIQGLTTEDFRGVHGVQVLDLQGNDIYRVQRFTFSGIRKDLLYLDLSRNRIRSLDGCVRYLSLLTALNLTGNRIERFEDGEFTGLNELTELYLEGNLIQTLGGQLQRLPQLQYLVISRNRIRTLRKEQIPERLKYLYLKGNPFRCDCELFPFLVQLNSSSNPGTDVALCTAPSSNRTTKLTGCPEPCECSCATDHQEDHFVSVDCSSRNLLQIPALFRTHNSSSGHSYPQPNSSLVILLPRRPLPTTVFSVARAPFVIEDEIGALDLSNNSLVVLGDSLPGGLRDLRLNDNRLGGPVQSLYSLTRLKRVTLAGNPWLCDCNTLSFKKWILSKSDIMLDANETRCGPGDPDAPNLTGRVIGTLTDLDLCPTDIGFYISLAFGLLSFFLLLAAAKIAWTRYELNVKVWLYSKGVTCVKERDIDRDKYFDAFLSFSHKDEEFVIRKIIKVIECKEPNIRLCLHYKHFLPGEYIHDNILNAVNNSKRTVLILSRNFLESEWCLMEFRAAHVQALKDRVHRIVVIKVGDLPEEIDPAIQLYLDSTTYLTWGERYFWSNLFYVLPTSGRAIAERKGFSPPYPQIRLDSIPC